MSRHAHAEDAPLRRNRNKSSSTTPKISLDEGANAQASSPVESRVLSRRELRQNRSEVFLSAAGETTPATRQTPSDRVDSRPAPARSASSDEAPLRRRRRGSAESVAEATAAPTPATEVATSPARAEVPSTRRLRRDRSDATAAAPAPATRASATQAPVAQPEASRPKATTRAAATVAEPATEQATTTRRAARKAEVSADRVTITEENASSFDFLAFGPSHAAPSASDAATDASETVAASSAKPKTTPKVEAKASAKPATSATEEPQLRRARPSESRTTRTRRASTSSSQSSASSRPSSPSARAKNADKVATGASFRRSTTPRRITAKSTSIAALALAGLMTVATSLPANALLSPEDVESQKIVASQTGSDAGLPSQYLSASSSIAPAALTRDTYGVLTPAKKANVAGIKSENTFTNDPNGTIQWPFAVGVHIGSGYGPRPGCSAGCSTNHKGQDFNPGMGAPIQSIADGVVVESTDSGSGFGVKIVIEHVINGKIIHSLYGHMIYGSRTVEVGDHVSVGQIIGKTGSTGISTGAHLHFEILINGTDNVDPLAWLYKNTN